MITSVIARQNPINTAYSSSVANLSAAHTKKNELTQLQQLQRAAAGKPQATILESLLKNTGFSLEGKLKELSGFMKEKIGSTLFKQETETETKEETPPPPPPEPEPSVPDYEVQAQYANMVHHSGG